MLVPAASQAAPVATSLRYSTAPSRASAVALDGATVAGAVYAFTAPDSATTSRVLFFIDDTARTKAAYHQENTAPFDLAGGTTTTASPYATTALANGAHTLTVVVYDAGGTQQVVTATFTVANAVGPAKAPEQIHLAWPAAPATTFTAVWVVGSASTPASLRYRIAGAATWSTVAGSLKTSGTAGSLRQATASGLTADSTYEYQVLGDGGTWSDVLSTRTVGATSPFSFVYEADTGVAGRLDGLAAGTLGVLGAIKAQDPNLILGGGDYISYDTDTRYATIDQARDAWFRQEQPLASRAPLMPTYGNHEVLLGEGFVGWANRFSTPTGVTGQDGTVGDARGNYSFDVGPVHFISFESVTEGTAEPAVVMTWLENDIVAAQARHQPWIVPFMHAGPITDGTNHATNFALQAQLGPLFERLGVPLVLSSHDQAFERSYPLTGLRDTRLAAPKEMSSSLTCYQDSGAGSGVVYLKVSPSGKLSNQANLFSRFASATKPGWTAVRDNLAHHYTTGQVTSTSITMTTYDVTSTGVQTVVDRFTIGKAPCSTGLSFAPSSASLSAATGATAATTASLTSSPSTPVTLSTSVPWLTATSVSGSTPATVTVAADAAGLAVGHYSGTVTATGGGGATAVLTVTFSVTATSTPTTLRVSTHADRTASLALSGATLTGPVYVVTTPDRAGTSKVLFYVDDPGRTKAAYHQENTAPYDLVGGTVTAATPFSSATLANGTHTITVAVYPATGPPEIVSATFTVAN